MNLLLYLLFSSALLALLLLALMLYVISVSVDITVNRNVNNALYIVSISIKNYKGYKQINFMIFPTKTHRREFQQWHDFGGRLMVPWNYLTHLWSYYESK